MPHHEKAVELAPLGIKVQENEKIRKENKREQEIVKKAMQN